MTPALEVSPRLHAALWERYAAGDRSVRDDLIVANLGLVKRLARHISHYSSVKTDFDELVSAGVVGLMAAIDAFDVALGTAFSTFAAPRIRGAILDDLRRHDHVSRSVRRKTRRLAKARQALTSKLGRSPDAEEMAWCLDTDVDTLWRWEREVEGTHQTQIGHSAADRSLRGKIALDLTSPETIPATEESAEDQVDRGQQAAVLRNAILTLKEQERTVLSLYYYEELHMREIASVIQVTESRVSQIHKAALRKLRTTLHSRLERAA